MRCCARCGREVYCAEQKVACNKVWHAFCFSCYKCGKLLDSCSVNPFNGEIFCKACYRNICGSCNPYSSPCCKSQPGCNNCCGTECNSCEAPCKPCGPSKTVILRTCSTPSENQCCEPKCGWTDCCSVPKCMDPCGPPVQMHRCRTPRPNCCGTKRCNPPPNCSNCCKLPVPREVANYYNRNHDACCRGCSAPPCCVPKCNKPCTTVECTPPTSCCPPTSCNPPPKCCRPSKCCSPPKCRSPPNCCPPKQCCSPPSSCLPEPCCLGHVPCDPCQAGCSPCQAGCSPCKQCPRKPVCYPPVSCCKPQPKEIICFEPTRCCSKPKCCACGVPDPCICEINCRRRMAVYCNAPCCRRCGHKVYAAEKVNMAGSIFHSCCFTCYCCNKPLDVASAYENQGEVHCKTCYCKYFGVQGYGYGTTLST